MVVEKKTTTNSRRRITFEEWKMHKDRESRMWREWKAAQDERMNEFTQKIDSDVRRDTKDRYQEHRAYYRTLDPSYKEIEDAMKNVVIMDDMPMTASRFSFSEQRLSDDKPLTFKKWLEKKNNELKVKQQTEAFKKKQESFEKRSRQIESERAYNEWMLKSKYRTLLKQYPNHSEEKIKNMLLGDLSDDQMELEIMKQLLEKPNIFSS